MIRYGLLPESFDAASEEVDVYDLDRRYFESLWYYPPGDSPELHRTGLPCAEMQTDRDAPYSPRADSSKK